MERPTSSRDHEHSSSGWTARAAALIAVAIAGGCAGSKSEAEPLPPTEPAPESAGEHACGNHAEGQCGAETSDPKGIASEGTGARRLSVAPGKFAEVNFDLKSGDQVAVTFGAPTDASIKWNVHSHGHDGGHVVHDEGTGGTGEVSFTAPSDGVFSFLWVNEGEDEVSMDFDVTLEGEGSVHSWIPKEGQE